MYHMAVVVHKTFFCSLECFDFRETEKKIFCRIKALNNANTNRTTLSSFVLIFLFRFFIFILAVHWISMTQWKNMVLYFKPKVIQRHFWPERKSTATENDFPLRIWARILRLLELAWIHGKQLYPLKLSTAPQFYRMKSSTFDLTFFFHFMTFDFRLWHNSSVVHCLWWCIKGIAFIFCFLIFILDFYNRKTCFNHFLI